VISNLLDAVLLVLLVLVTPSAARRMNLPAVARRILIIGIFLFAAVSLLAVGHSIVQELAP
jgi:hypothetical protein